eukprot:552980-Amphidinium_carterae.1
MVNWSIWSKSSPPSAVLKSWLPAVRPNVGIPMNKPSADVCCFGSCLRAFWNTVGSEFSSLGGRADADAIVHVQI